MSTADHLLTLNSAMTQLMRSIRHIDDGQGVGRARLSALAVLHFGGPCSLSNLARQEMVSSATMHHVVKGLEKDGLLRREQDPHDGRTQVLHLTGRGTDTIAGAHAARINYLAALSSRIPATQLKVAAQVLDQLRTNAWSERENES